MQKKEPEPRPKVPMIEAALTYASNGWPVFPLLGKTPLKGSNGHKDATCDQQKIQEWWSKNPTANIGLATGKLSGLLVLDVDPRHGGHDSFKKLEAAYGPFPQTRMSRTAHGGLHRFYGYPNDNNRYPNAVELQGLPGIDVRGDGGYVVLPPSRLYDRLSYIWGDTAVPIAPAPRWLLDTLTKQPVQHEKNPQGGGFARVTEKKWLSEAVEKAREGNRNQIGFSLACQLRDDGFSQQQAHDIMLSYVDQVGSGKTPYTAKEALTSLKSAYSKPSREQARRTY
jgi:bifunctional DNA primase/polymerase-like protein